MHIPFGDLKRQYLSIKDEIDRAVADTLLSGRFILGKRLEQFEEEFAQYCGARFGVGVGSGTEALHLALRVLGVSSEDEVVTVSNTCVPTASAITLANARVVLCDVDPTSFTMDALDLERRITSRTKAIIPVHLYGQSADLDPIHEIARSHGIEVIEDAAQAHGTAYKGKRIGSISIMTCFSFYPTKNLGAFGDGGMITTNDEALVKHLRMMRNYGQQDRYHHPLKGFNSRLDEVQAAVLSAKLKHLDQWNERRRVIASSYQNRIRNDAVTILLERKYGKHVYHLYVVRVSRRSEFQSHLLAHGIETLIHYPIPIHKQKSYQDLGYKLGDFPATERLAEEIVSLPIYPELTDDEIDYICSIIDDFK